MLSPFKGNFKVTSVMGYRTLNGKREYHKGLDLVGLDSDIVYAIADGFIENTVYEKNGFGWYVRQRLEDGRKIYYGHLKEKPKMNYYVYAGEPIGIMGSTGNSTGKHTHIELRTVNGEHLFITTFTEIPNNIGTYYGGDIMPTIDEMYKIVQEKCGLENQTMDFLRAYKYSDDLIKKLYQQMI